MKFDLPLLDHVEKDIIKVSGMEMTGPLTFNTNSENPETIMDLVTRGEVKESLKEIDAAGVASPLPKERFGTLTGDVTYDKATGNINLVPSGVTTDAYLSVEVDAKGRVIGGSKFIDPNQIDTIDYNKIDGLPKTVGGWGVEGVFSLNDVMDNDVKMNIHPNEVDQVATKGYLDTVVDNNNDIGKPGRVIDSYSDKAVPGYLRANNGKVSKLDYPELFEVLGSKFGPDQDVVGAGKPWVNQYDFNEATSIGAWVQDTNLPIANYLHQCVVTKNRLYMIGGANSNGSFNAVYYAPILEDGSLGTWTQDTNLPTVIVNHQCVVIKDRLYMISGHNGYNLNTVYYAPILEDGSLGAWVQDTNLPISSGYPQCVVTKNRLYMIGGQNPSGNLNTVYYAPILEDGSLGTWVRDTNLPISNAFCQCVVIKDRLYMIGGGIGSVASNTVYYAPILEDGSLGTWIQDANLPIVNYAHQCVVTKNRLYMIGGSIGSGRLNTVYYAPILEDGSLGTWVKGANLPIGIYHHRCVVTKNRLYMIGGNDGSGAIRNTVYYAPLVIPQGKQGGKNDYSEYYNYISVLDRLNKVALPHTHQATFNDRYNSISNFSTIPDQLTNDLFNSTSLVTKNKAFLLGGSIGNAAVDTILSSTITDGVISTFTTETNTLPKRLSQPSLITYNNHVYLIGGRIDSLTGTSSNEVYKAPIDNLGNIGTFTKLSYDLPVGVHDATTVLIGNRIYILAGKSNNTDLQRVYYTDVSITGDTFPWKQLPNVLPLSFPTEYKSAKAYIANDKVHLLVDATLNNEVTIFTSTIRENKLLSPFKQGSFALPINSATGGIVSTKYSTFLIGGNGLDIIKIDQDASGEITAVSDHEVLNHAASNGAILTTSKYIYYVGGLVGDPVGNTFKSIQRMSFLGGKDDYSEHYPDVINPNDPEDAYFHLPKLEDKKDPNKRYFIKY